MLWDVGGTEKHLYYLTKYLNKDKFNCSIVTFDLKEIFVKKIREEGIKVIFIPVKRHYTLNALLKAFKLKALIKKHNIDIVQTFHFKSDTYGVLVSKLSGVSKIISSRRDVGDLKKPRQIFLNKIINRFIDRYITVCNTVGEKVHKTEGIPRDKMITIYNGVDLNKFNPNNTVLQDIKENLGLKEDDFVIGTSAVFRPEKAYHILFKGIEKVLPFIKNLKVLVLGSGVTKSYFEDYCNRGPLRDIVKFMGFVDDVENYLPLMNIFCYVPDKNEGFSNAILEAMAMERPIIATDVGGNTEAVANGINGIIIPPSNADALADAILYLYNNSDTRCRMGIKSRERVEQFFTLQQMIKNHERLYLEMMNLKR